MPDMYSQDEYDLAGYATGVVDQDKMLTTALPKAGDVLIGLASSGIHSNGYSLVRQVLFKDHDVKLSDQPAELNGQTVGEALLTPTRIYVKPVLPLIKKGLIHGVSHITGGGLPENLPRMLLIRCRLWLMPAPGPSCRFSAICKRWATWMLMICTARLTWG